MRKKTAQPPSSGIKTNKEGNVETAEALRRSEERFRMLTESTSDWIWETDAEGRYTYSSPKVRDVLGYEPEEIIGRSAFEFMSDEEAKRIEGMFQSIVQSKKPFSALENRNVHKNGKEVILETSGVPIFDEKGTLLGFRGIDRDITRRKHNEEKFQYTLSMLKATIESTADGILVVDRQGKVAGFNQKFAEMWRIPLRILESRDDTRVLSFVLNQLKDPEAFLKRVMELYINPEAESYDVIEFIDGRIYERYSQPQRIEEKIVGRVWSFRNVTDQRRVLAALRESEERFRATFEQAAVGVAHLSPDGRFLLVNQKFCDIVGYTQEELLQKTFQKITYPYDLNADLENLRMLLADEIQYYTIHKRYIRKDGSLVWVNLTASLVRDAAGDPAYGIAVIEDISEHRKLEEQLFQSQKMEAVGQLAGGIAHDFNNLLTAIIGYGNLLKTDISRDSRLTNYVGQILNAAEKAAILTKDLLTFGRKQLGNPRPVDLNKIIQEMGPLLSRSVGEAITLSLHLSDNDLIIMADTVHIEQGLMNLAMNARDAMPGGGTVAVRTERVNLDRDFIQTHGYGRKGSYALLSFEDTGIGMDMDTRERIFEPFFSTKEVGRGTGLGLAIVYGIVKQHEGYITVSSERGKGTSFNIFLPLIPGISGTDTFSQNSR